MIKKASKTKKTTPISSLNTAYNDGYTHARTKSLLSFFFFDYRSQCVCFFVVVLKYIQTYLLPAVKENIKEDKKIKIKKTAHMIGLKH